MIVNQILSKGKFDKVNQIKWSSYCKQIYTETENLIQTLLPKAQENHESNYYLRNNASIGGLDALFYI